MIDILVDSKGSSEHVSPNDMLTPADSKNCLNCVCQDRDWRGGGVAGVITSRYHEHGPMSPVTTDCHYQNDSEGRLKVLK